MVIIHGFVDHKNRKWIKRMVRDLAVYTDSNSCVVDWSKIATTTYKVAAGDARKVGERIGDFILSLQNHIPLDKVSMLGVSLGAHIAGIAGQWTGGRVDAIYGLDPAHPRFTLPMKPESDRLDTSDANFVQVLHTTSGVLGTPFNIGHQDWYADDGKIPQKGCEPGRIVFDPMAFDRLSLGCSHMRSVEIFRFSLNPQNRYRPVRGHDHFGYWSRRVPGVYYFPTVRDPPYVNNTLY